MQAIFIKSLISLCILTVAFAGNVYGEVPNTLVERSEWGTFFNSANADGTIVIIDTRTEGTSYVYNPERSKTRLTVASTFKIPHALFLLDAGIIENEFQVFPWDNKQRSVGLSRYDAVWNSDQTLQTSMRYSVVWLYQQFARELGRLKEMEYLEKINYGNATIGDAVDQFWLDGSLQISAMEQIGFLERLYSNQLPFSVNHQRLVKDIMITEAGADYKMRSKTGWGTPDNSPHVGWYIGWVERDDGAIFFALNINTPNGIKDLSERKTITHAILRSINALPN